MFPKTFRWTDLCWAPEGAEGGSGAGDPPNPPAGEGEGKAAPSVAKPTPDPVPAQATSQPDWRDDRIDELTAKWRDAEKDGLSLREQNKLLQDTLDEIKRTGKDGGVLDEAKIQSKAKELADTELARREWLSLTTKMYDAGVAEFEKAPFDLAISQLARASLGGKIPDTIVLAADEAGEPHKIIMELSKDLDNFARISKLTPVKQAVEIARMAAPPPAKRASRAPAPVDPLTPGGQVNDDPAKMTDNEWLAWREKQFRPNGAARP